MCDVGEIVETAANVGTFGTYGMAANTIQGKSLFADGNFGYFDAIGGMGGSGEEQFGFQSDYLRQNREAYDAWANDYIDPARYEAMVSEYEQNARTGAANQYANVGLAGSSAAFGGANEAARKTRMGMMDRQLSDRNQIEQTRLAYTGQLQNVDIAKLNAQMAKQQADQQMLSGLLSAGGAVAGGILAGPPGAMAGGKMGGSMGGGGASYNPMEFNNYGQPGNYWAENPYSGGY